MQQFIAKFKEKLLGVVSGFDRLIFRGVLRGLVYSRGMEEYLWQNHILFKDYSYHVKKISERVRQAAGAEFVEDQLPVLYLASPKADKDKIAQEIAAQRGIQQGPVCALSTMEPALPLSTMANTWWLVHDPATFCTITAFIRSGDG